MGVKVLVMFALFAPVLMLTAGIFARRETAGDNIGNGHPEDPGKTAHSAPLRPMAQAAETSVGV